MTGPHTAEGWVLKLARERADLHHTELHVLSVLAMRHNRDYGAAHPKIELVGRETHISVRQIQRILNALASEERTGGAVLHISYGPLPFETPTGRPAYGNVYRFVGFDAVPDNVRPRRQLGGRPATRPDDTTSSSADDTLTSQPDDTGDRFQMTSGGGSDDISARRQMTSVRSPLYPVVNPASSAEEDRYPVLNPVRVRARDGPEKCPVCGEEIDRRGDGHRNDCPPDNCPLYGKNPGSQLWIRYAAHARSLALAGTR